MSAQLPDRLSQQQPIPGALPRPLDAGSKSFANLLSSLLANEWVTAAAIFAFTRLVGLVGIVADKDAAGMLEVLEPALDHIVVTRSSSPRAMRPEDLGKLAVELFGESRVTVVRDLPDALEQAVTLAEADGMGGGVIATGSVITAGEVRLLLGHTDV